MTLLLLYVALAIGVSFLCSILEAVLLSISPSFIASQQEARPALAAKLKALKEDIDRPLAAILSLNTIAHTIGAAGAGAQAAYVFGDAAITIFSAVLTFLILILSEIIPKTLGATYWRQLAGFVARVLPWLIWSMWPLVKMSQGLTYLMGGGGHGAISRDEIAALADVGHQEGVVHESESRIVRNLLRLDALTVEAVMTPRTVIFSLPRGATVKEAMAEVGEMHFSRIPLTGEGIDDVTGFVLKSDILLAAARDEHDKQLHELRRDLTRVPEETPLRGLFETLLEGSHHIAIVVDPYGGTAGLVTQEDVVETLLGLEIVDEGDETHDLQAFARKRWEERAKRLGVDRDAMRERVPEAPGGVVQYGITGGVVPSDNAQADAGRSGKPGSDG